MEPTETFTLYVYPMGGSACITTTVLKELLMEPTETFIMSGDEKLILDAGGTISAVASALSGICVAVNYVEM
jgi:hypothetical protein